jgi:cyclohexanone monooxygenase
MVACGSLRFHLASDSPLTVSSTESFLYRYSWDDEDLTTYPWTRRYLQGPEILAYLKHVVKRHGLRKHFQFNTELTKAQWDDSEGRWTVVISTGQTLKTKYLVTALGLLTKENVPKIPGICDFRGETHHTARWPKGFDIRGKRVGVIGNGSTGVQVITAIAKDVKQLVCFQRTPQYSVPSGDEDVHPTYRSDLNARYPDVWKQAKDSMFAFGFKESTRTTFSVSEEEREKIFENAWRKGGGFRFMFETFSDISYDEAANEAAADFIRRKISQIVKDPDTSQKLKPTDYYARRPLCDPGYYEQFNRSNVELVDLKDTPITKITSAGIELSNGHICELDVIVFATGFDAVEGVYNRIAIEGRNRANLRDHWADIGPTSYLGISVPNFPNMFMVLGPSGPFSNAPPLIETQVEFISELIEIAEKKGSAKGGVPNHTAVNRHADGDNTAQTKGKTHVSVHAIEATLEAEQEWTQLCDKLSTNSLFRKTDSWIFGANIPGKVPAVKFYFGGLANYRQVLRNVLENGLEGFKQLY